MRRLAIAALIAVSIAACQRRGIASSAADSTALLAAYEQYRTAWLRDDTAAVLGRISNDIRILISGVPDIVGQDATRKLFLDEMAKYRHTALRLDHHDVIVAGDHATVIGTYDETLELRAPRSRRERGKGNEDHNRGRYITIWRREDGEWRIVRYMLNDLPIVLAPRSAP